MTVPPVSTSDVTGGVGVTGSVGVTGGDVGVGLDGRSITSSLSALTATPVRDLASAVAVFRTVPAAMSSAVKA
jgi:hypothetical protein